MRSCYLCGRFASKTEKISLHKFPKNPEICKKWVEICGLQETDDVSHLFLCSLHFKVPRNLIVQEKWKLPLGIIPNLDITDVSTTNVTTLPEISLNHPPILLSNVLKDSTNIPKSIETSLNISDDINCDRDAPSTSKVSYSNSEEDCYSPPKKRFFAEPRYISEINSFDVSTPRKARRVIKYIKTEDEKKRKQIKSLQDQNRRLVMRIAKLQDLMSHLKESSLISDDAGDHLMVEYMLK
ncbi:uncharacterized protein LOC112468932 isoform X1 [Temnothorax curvispinosus]|uniref:Uncharacterized protein LOC112468932 isoform X1 n=2 Tax=Temnothorax curvispinosus TaxID=300111 RepID=A0A6J1RNK2_9HYME|nr:uncharacterized protein LOC112468932 isoform X1 [Temnothorax curvispinosus]